METGVSSIPVSEVGVLTSSTYLIFLLLHHKFYCEPHANIGEKYARFAFCKDAETLKRAAKRLEALVKYM